MLERVDKEASARLQVRWKQGIELRHEDVRATAMKSYLVATSVKVSRDLRNMTCPIRTLAIFVHNRDLDYQ